MRAIPERDWKLLRRKKDDLLNRCCQRINAEAESLLADKSASAYERYLQVFRHYRDADRMIEACFDDWRRSTAWLRMLAMCQHDILTEADLREFSDETQDVIANLTH